MKLLVLTLLLTFVTPTYAVLIGKVNIQKILLEVNEGKKVKNKLKREFEKKQGLLKKEEGKIRKMNADFEKQSLVMNDKAKQKRQAEIQQSMIKLQQTTMTYQREMQALEKKYKEPILKKIQAIIKAISKKQGLDMTFEISAAALVYTKQQKDITGAVISLYNKKYKAKK
jgi:outer membrane protein